MKQTFKAGLNFRGKPMHFDLRYAIGLPVAPDECYRPACDGLIAMPVAVA
ncbi:MAG: hypothetical protein J6N51_03565 [Selenomonas sp.]|nr:hypothetical protein [Selenomonas sp.]